MNKQVRKSGFLISCLLIVGVGAWTQKSETIKKILSLYPDRIEAIDVKHIALDLEFDWKRKQAYGTAKITLSPLMSTNIIFLDAGMLTINSIVLAKGTLIKFKYDSSKSNNELEVTLDKIYKPSEEIILKINYHTNWINNSDPNLLGGSFGKGLRFFEPTQTTPIKRRQIWSAGEAECNKYWFPCCESINDLRTTEFTATVDEKLTVISNGDLLEIKRNADGTKTFHYKASKPYPNFLTSFVAGEYIIIKQNYKNIPLYTFCYPDEKKAAEATTARLPDMVNFFSTITGIKYPYGAYSQVTVQDYPFPGLIGQNMVSTISDNMIDDYRTHADFLYLWDGVEANALASQWFGNMITAKDWNHIWLMKSFANFLEGLYTNYKNGHDEYLMWYYPYENGTVMGDWASGIRHPIVTRNFDNTESFVGDNYAKFRGSLVLRMLHKQLGEDKWQRAFKHFVKQSAFKQVTTKDFQQSIKTATGESLDWFFDQWIYKMGQPFFKVENKYDSIKKQLILIITQMQKIDSLNAFPQVEFFKGKMDIEIDERVETIWIESKFENSYTFKLSQKPKLINPDFEGIWIKEISIEKTSEEWLFQFQNSKDILARNAALNELVTIARNKKITEKEKAEIEAAFHIVIQGKSYWRLKTAALNGLQRIYAPSSNISFYAFNATTINLLLATIKKEKAWIRATAITMLGMTNDAQYADLYLSYLKDESERVIAAAAIALGKTKSPKAFDALVTLKDKPSWKNQSLINSLNGLKELGDQRAVAIAVQALSDNQSPRWFLGNFWDYPLIAAQTLTALGEGAQGYPIVMEKFKKSMDDNNLNDIFQTVLLITTLADPKAQEVFDLLKMKYKNDANTMIAVNQFEAQFKQAIRK